MIHVVDGVTRNVGGWRRQPKDARDLPFKALLSLSPAQKGFRLDPSSRNDLVPPVWDQGSIGSCTAHGTLGVAEATRLRENLGGDPLSRLFNYYESRTAVEGRDPTEDSGAFVRDALKALATYGAPFETLWPYDTEKFSVRPPDAVFAAALQHRAIRYYSLDDLDWIRACLTLGYCVTFGFDVPQSFVNGSVGQSGQLLLPRPGEGFVGGHCVYMRGHDDAHVNEPGDTGALLCRNSWGPSWGLNGDFWLPYSYVKEWLATDFWTVHAES